MKTFRPRTWVLLIGSLSLVGCDACDPEPTPWPEPEDPELASVRIEPNAVTLELEEEVEIRVFATDEDLVEFDPLSRGLAISWTWTAEVTGATAGMVAVPEGVFLSGTTANPIALTVTNSNVAKVVLKASVTQASRVRTDQIVVTMVAAPPPPPPPPEPADQVQVAPSLPPVVALLNGCTFEETADEPPPAHWLLYDFTTLVNLSENLTDEGGCKRSPEFAIFSEDHRPILFLSRPSSDLKALTSDAGLANEWTDELGDLLEADKLEWKDRDLIQAELHPFVEGDWTAEQSPDADELFNKNRAGLGFNGYQPTGLVLLPSEKPGECKQDYILNEFGIDLKDDPTPPSQRFLYVVFVKDITPGSPKGKTCPLWQKGQVVFLNENGHLPETLAHEYVHVLGHREPYQSFDHTGNVFMTLKGFTKSNLMHEFVGETRDYVSLGQSIRMLIEPNSWYQISADPIGRHPTRECGCDAYGRDLCPQVHRRPGEGGKPFTDLEPSPCTVKLGEDTGGHE